MKLLNCGRRPIKSFRDYQSCIDRFRGARSDPSLVVLEGFHPLKHALSFGAIVLETITLDAEALGLLTNALAPDLAEVLGKGAAEVPPEVFQLLSPVPPGTGVIAIARRPEISLLAMLQSPAPAPLVFLENPRSHGNMGAAVRVTAAAGGAGVIVSGEHDPWHPSALVGATGLHFAVPVSRAEGFPIGKMVDMPAASLPLGGRTLVVIDPGGEQLRPGLIPDRALLAFGSEREGVSPCLLDAADRCLAIPMFPGVSSLNLATAVAIVIYTWRLAQGSV